MADAFRIYNVKEKKIHATVLITSKKEALQKMEPGTKHDPDLIFFIRNIIEKLGHQIKSNILLK